MNHPFYEYQFVTKSSEVEYQGFTKRWTFRFRGKSWPYLVFIEQFEESHLYAVKFFPKDHSNSQNKYNLLTRQFEPRSIFNTIIKILGDFIDHWDSQSVFCYLAAPSPVCEGYNNNRKFRFYQRAGFDSLNPETWHVDYNSDHSAVILFQRNNINQGQALHSDVMLMIEKVFSEINWSRKMCQDCDDSCEKWKKLTILQGSD